MSDATDTAAPAEPVCESCEPIAGGESTDFGGELTACEAVNERVSIDATEAEARGFDLDRARALIERPIDAQLRWTARDEPSGDAPEGYESDTRIEGTVRITSYTHVLPGDELCGETTCEYEGIEPFARDSCPHRLELGVEIELATADGAIDAVAEGEAGIWAHGFEDVIGENTADEVHAHAGADLRDVRGSLRLHPDPSREHAGMLLIHLDFLEAGTGGHVWPTILYADEAELSPDAIWLNGDHSIEGIFGDVE